MEWITHISFCFFNCCKLPEKSDTALITASNQHFSITEYSFSGVFDQVYLQQSTNTRRTKDKRYAWFFFSRMLYEFCKMLIIVRKEEFCTDKNPCCSNDTHYQSQLTKEFTNDCCCCWSSAQSEISPDRELNQNFFLHSLTDTKLLLGHFWGVKLLQRGMLPMHSYKAIFYLLQSIGRRHNIEIHGSGRALQ